MARHAMTKRNPIPQGVRFAVFMRDNFTCRYCGVQSSADVTLHCDHIIPVSKGGTDDAANLVAACAGCNFGKGVKEVDAPGPPAVSTWRGATGLFGHTFKYHDRDKRTYIERQFKVLHRASETTYAVQLFSWVHGYPTDVVFMSDEEISKCRLYASEEDWRSTAERENEEKWARRRVA